MTRHKQQLLQEQENLLEQIQKQNSVETNSNPEDANSEHPTKEQLQNSSGKIKRSPRKNSISRSPGNETQTNDATSSNDKANGEENASGTRHSLSSSLKIDSTTNELSTDERSNSHEHSGHLMALLKDNNSTHDATSNRISSITDKNHHQHQPHTRNYPQSSSRSRSPHDPLKRHSTNSTGYSDHVGRPSTNHRSGSSYAEYAEEMKVLDNSLFGRRMVSYEISIK